MSISVVSDASVIIDMESGNLLTDFFAADLSIHVPDLLFDTEIAPYTDDLVALGLQILILTEASMIYLDGLVDHGPSFYDLTALSLAKQQGYMLLTSDAGLRQLAEKEGVEVHGTLWVVERMLQHGLLDVERAGAAFERMRAGMSRLPWGEVDALLTRYKE